MASKTVLPTVQRAWIQTSKGFPSRALAQTESWPVVEPMGTDTLVRVHSVSLNPIFYKLMILVPGFGRKLPGVPEADLAGVVVRSGSSKFKTGDEVFGTVEGSEVMATGNGALKQFVSVKENCLAPKPKNVSFEEASGLALVGLTAWEAFTKHSVIRAGTRVFINGGSTGVGRIAIQIAKLKGAHVAASCSGANVAAVLALGADEVFDYTTSPLSAQLNEAAAASQPYDIVFDTVGLEDVFNASPSFLQPHGVFVDIGLDSEITRTWRGFFSVIRQTINKRYRPVILGGVPRTYRTFILKVTDGAIDELAAWVAEGKVKPSVDSVHAFDREGVMAAYDRIMTGRAQGKVVISVPQ